MSASCAMAGCTEPRHKVNDLLCGAHRRIRVESVPSMYPMCSTAHCPRRARRRVPGSLCGPCRLELGDTSVMCMTDGCGRQRVQRGLCDRCIKAGRQGLPPRARRPKGGTCEVECCSLVPKNHGRYCGKHAVNRKACVAHGCATTAVVDGRCEKHRTNSSICRSYRCGEPRFRAQLCKVHYEKQNPEQCARTECDNAASAGIYCRLHNLGIDFAAGDWHDWVAVDQLWWGRLDPERQPTVPELDELFDRAERAGLGARNLSRQVGIDENRLIAWRQVLGRVERQGVAAA